MSVRIVQLGSPRVAGEGLRIGSVRRPPRGVRKEDYARLDYFDVWLPNLAPSDELMKQGKAVQDEKAWQQFCKQFRAELNQPLISRELDLLAALSQQADFSLGCYCENEARCHRSVLRDVLRERGAKLA